MNDIPADAIPAAAEAMCDRFWHDPDDCPCTEAATVALEAAAPLIAARAAAAERERIRQRLAEDAVTLRTAGRVASAEALQRHADLLDGAP